MQDPPSIYEGSEDFTLWTARLRALLRAPGTHTSGRPRGSTANTDLQLSATDIPSPTFYVPEAVDATTTYEYLLTVSAENAEDPGRQRCR